MRKYKVIEETYNKEAGTDEERSYLVVYDNTDGNNPEDMFPVAEAYIYGDERVCINLFAVSGIAGINVDGDISGMLIKSIANKLENKETPKKKITK